jgi:hypothetical protein
MYISKVLSNLRAWELLQTNYPQEFMDIQKTISKINPKKQIRSLGSRKSNLPIYSTIEINQALDRQFVTLGWARKRIWFDGRTRKHSSELDAVKHTIGIEVILGKYSFSESAIFVKFPLFIKMEGLQVAVLILPIKEFAQSMAIGVGEFEMVSERINEVALLIPKYPFVIIGLSDIKSNIEVEEITSPLDNYLIETLGYSLSEMKIQAERPNYDFKVQLPSEAQKIAKEICAFANCKGGGIILVGIDDNGIPVGITRESLDESQRRVISIGTGACNPSPEVECFPFDTPNNNKRCILVVRISEMEQKPCMTNERVYIRAGTMARVANSEEIRRLLLKIPD